ncbi:hypothetical protein RJ639_026351 [Escallonia herrerae]|uniref:ATPase AAA-type core domain-containing protein n=1 Tax=Escallonia herrerae TaxID=1293975 RepID=A0AA88UT46_9ASTE|nr:hypothetical protein RJ639_026351 [Escallonia herrerae]
MGSELKQAIVEDLDKFIKGKDFYRKIGRAWKRGYLLYGPPGTGKSSLTAAMVNYLNYDIYDLDLTDVESNADLGSLLLSMSNRSILIIEDIECTIKLQNRESQEELNNQKNRIEELLRQAEVTPAEVAGVLMKKANTEVSLRGLLQFLENKVSEQDKRAGMQFNDVNIDGVQSSGSMPRHI